MPEATRPHRSSHSAAALVLLGSLTVTLPILKGGVGLAAEGWALAIAGAAAALALWRAREVPWCALGLAAVALVVALQLLPLPPGLHALSPGARAAFRMSLEPLGAYPAWRPLTLDLPATARELAKAIACLAAFTAAWTYAETVRRRSKLLGALGLAAAAVSAAVLGAGLAGAQPFLAGRFPFVNPNHLAGFLDLTAFVALGLAVRSHGHDRFLWGLAFAAATAVLFASLSRGGVLAYFVGLAIFGALVLSRRTQTANRRRITALAAATALGLGAAAYLALGPVEQELRTVRSTSQEAKIAQWPAGLRMIRDFPVAGIGRGAFATVFPAYKTDPTVLTFTHLENEWLQAVIDLGLPGGLLLLGVLAAIWARAVLRRELSAEEMGLAAGVGALFVHELFDFSLETLGVAIPLAVALGLLARGARVVAVRPWTTRAGLVLLAVAGAAGLGYATVHRAEPAGAIAGAEPERAVELARAAALLRPGDYLPHAAAGARLAAGGRCAEAIPWLARATAFAPGVPEPHLLAGRCLADRAPALARTEYRIAHVLGLPGALDEAAERWTDLDDLYDLVLETGDGLLALGTQLMSRQPALARQVLERALAEYGEARALLPLGRVELALGDAERSLALARRRVEEQPQDEGAHRLAADSLLAMGKPDEARAALERGIEAVPGSPALLGLLARRLIAERRYSEARRIAESIPAWTGAEVAHREQLVAGALAAQGRLVEALDRAQAAAAALPDRPGPLLEVARLASEIGRHAEAIAALERAAALPGAAPGRYAEAIATARSRLAAQEARRRERVMLEPSLETW